MIIFIDDEPRDTASYTEDLKDEGREVKVLRYLDEASEFLNQPDINPELLILDIMMPAGEVLKDSDTEDGVRSGEHFYKIVRQKFPALPVIILTNNPSNDLAEKFKSDTNCRFCRKSDYLPYQLSDLVSSLISK